MKVWMLALAAMVQAIPALAADVLEPASPRAVTHFAGYEEVVQYAFRDAYRQDVRIRMIEIPSFVPELAIGVKEDNGKYSIFGIRPEISLWHVVDEKGSTVDKLPTTIREVQTAIDRNDIKFKRCDAAIDSNLALRLIAVWREMLARARKPPRPELALDGTDFNFAMRSGDRDIAAKTWSPDPSTPPGMLVRIAETMTSLCKLKYENLSALLDHQVDALSQRLQR